MSLVALTLSVALGGQPLLARRSASASGSVQPARDGFQSGEGIRSLDAAFTASTSSCMAHNLVNATGGGDRVLLTNDSVLTNAFELPINAALRGNGWADGINANWPAVDIRNLATVDEASPLSVQGLYSNIRMEISG